MFQTGRFTYDDAVYVWAILGGFSVGLLATTLARLYSSSYYALRDTRTPLRYALAHVGVATVLGYFAAIVLPPRLGINPLWGTAGLTAAASVGGWVELVLLRRTLNDRIGHTGLPAALSVRLWSAALIAAGVAWAAKLALPPMHPIASAALILIPYVCVYLGLTVAMGVGDARQILRRIRANV